MDKFIQVLHIQYQSKRFWRRKTLFINSFLHDCILQQPYLFKICQSFDLMLAFHHISKLNNMCRIFFNGVNVKSILHPAIQSNINGSEKKDFKIDLNHLVFTPENLITWASISFDSLVFDDYSSTFEHCIGVRNLVLPLHDDSRTGLVLKKEISKIWNWNCYWGKTYYMGKNDQSVWQPLQNHSSLSHCLPCLIQITYLQQDKKHCRETRILL